jgi:hypothetical protein
MAALIPWSPPKIVCVTGDSVHPGTQDPESQVSPDTWITEIQTYLKDNILPDDSASTDWIARLAKRYTLVDGGGELLTEVHGGECGNHASSCTLIGKAFQHGFYWPTTLQDVVQLVKTYHACQFCAKQIHTPAQTLQMIPPS